MKVCFSLYGGPGTGKSRAATRAFSDIKEAGVNAEYIPEHVKLEYAWQGKKPEDIDQFSIFGEQTQAEKKLFHPKHGPDVTITDSPVYLQTYYAAEHGSPELKLGFELLVKEYYRMAAARGVHHVHVWVKRTGAFNPKGRFQTKEEAEEIDVKMLKYLQEQGVDFHYCDGTKEDITKFVLTYLSQLNPAQIGGCY